MPREHRPDPAAQSRLDRFDEALRRWAQRPAPPPPWPLASSTRAGRRRRAPRWQLVGASLALVAALAAGLLLRTRWAPSGAAPAAEAPAGAAVAALASPDEVLILWLDADTPLYLTLPSAAEAADLERSTR